MLLRITCILLAGGVGALARYFLAGFVQGGREGFPWGTIAVNMAGCFLFGLLWSITEERIEEGHELRLMVFTGFMGAFTTFSTFMFETGKLMQTGHHMLAAGNVLMQNTVGIVCLIAGMALGRFV